MFFSQLFPQTKDECSVLLEQLVNSTDFERYAALKRYMKAKGWSTTDVPDMVEPGKRAVVPKEALPSAHSQFPVDVAFSQAPFDIYWDAYGDRTEVCPAYHFASALAQVGEALGKRFYLDGRVGRLYPNWYQCLIGPSTFAAKSKVAEDTTESIEDIFSRYEEDTLRHKQIMSFGTPEGLLEVFATHDKSGSSLEGYEDEQGVRVFAWIDEIRGLFAKARQSASEGLIPELTKIYKCPKWLMGGSVSSKYKGIHPYLNILGCTTQEWFEQSVSVSDIEGGFVNRFVFYLHDQQDLKPLMDLPNPKTEQQWRELLRQLESEGIALERIFDLDEDCLEDYKDWYIETKSALIDNPSSLEVIAGARVIEHTLKLALVFSVFENKDGDNYIHKDAFDAAKSVAEYWASVTVSLFTNLTFDKTSKLERDIIRVLGQNNVNCGANCRGGRTRKISMML